MIYTLHMFLRRLFNLDVMDAAAQVVARKNRTIREMEVICAEKDAEIERLHLAHVRNVCDLIGNFIQGLEEGRDMNETLEAGLQDLKDHVARLEEHSTL